MTWTLHKKVNIHFIGISQIIPVDNSKYFFTIGAYTEKTITLWNLMDFTVIQTKNMKYPVIDLAVDYIYNFSLKNISFTTITQHAFSLWKYSAANKLTSAHFKHEDIEQEPEVGEFFVSLEVTPYYEYCKCAYCLVGTNKGSILQISKDNDMKVYFIKKYKIDTQISPIIRIKYYNNRKLIVADAKGRILMWRYSNLNMKTKQPGDTMFDFIKDNKAMEEALIGKGLNGLNALYIEDGDVMLSSTDHGEIYFIKDEKGKLISKRITKGNLDKINVIEVECDDEGNIFSLGENGEIFLWDKINSYDLNGCIKIEGPDVKKGEDTEKAKINSFFVMGDLLVALVEIKTLSSVKRYLELFELNNKISIGKFEPTSIDVSKDENEVENIIKMFKSDHNNKPVILSLSSQNKIYYSIITKTDKLYQISTCQLIQKDIFNEITKEEIIFLSHNNLNDFLAVTTNDTTVSLFQIESSSTQKKLSDMKDSINIYKHEHSSIEEESEKHTLQLKYNALEKINYQIQTKTVFENNNGFIVLYSEIIPNIYIRNYIKKEITKVIPLQNYHPCTLSISPNRKYYFIGTKEGMLAIITRLDLNSYNGFKIDVSNSHFDTVNCVNSSKKCVISCSYGEIIVWNQ